MNGNRSRFEDAFFKRRWMALWLALAEGCVMEYSPELHCDIEEFVAEGMPESKWGRTTLYRIRLSVTTRECKYTFIIK